MKVASATPARPSLAIPAVRPTDGQDVVWALETAGALYRRHERTEAIAWLRRGAEAAGLAGDDDRALELARVAADMLDEARRPSSDIRSVVRPPASSSSLQSAPPSADAFDDDETPTRPATDRVAAILGVLETAPPSSDDARRLSAARITLPELDVDLHSVPELTDLPDEARASLARASLVTVLTGGQFATDFALALVVSGAFELEPRSQPAHVARLGPGAMLRARGTRGEPVPFRLACVTESGVLATWGEAAVNAALHTAPWVEDDLRAAADPLHAAVGAMSGAVGAAMDDDSRVELARRAETRSFLPGEEIVAAGDRVPGALLLGAGALHVGSPPRRVHPGELLFGVETLSGDVASTTVRAAETGALVLVIDRGLAQEMGTRCPPLLEILSR